MPELEWNDDEDVNRVVEVFYHESDGFFVHMRIGVEQENGDHPILVMVSKDRWHLSAEIDTGHADLNRAKLIAPKFAAMLLEEARAQYDEAMAGVDTE